MNAGAASAGRRRRRGSGSSGIRKRFGSIEALRGVDLDLLPGEVPGPGRRQCRRQVDADQDHRRRLRARRRHDRPRRRAGRLRHAGRGPGAEHRDGLPGPLACATRSTSRATCFSAASRVRSRARASAARPSGGCTEDAERIWTRWKSTSPISAHWSPSSPAGSASRSRSAAPPPSSRSVLIMDEPTSALAVAEVEAVLRLIRRASRTRRRRRPDHPPAAGPVPRLRPHRGHVRGRQGRRAPDRRDRPGGPRRADRRREGQAACEAPRDRCIPTARGGRSQGSATADFLRRRRQCLASRCSSWSWWCLFGTVTEAFTSQVNLLNLLRQSAPLLIVAVAMTFVITTGGIDLSVGSTVALVNALAAILLQAGVPWPFVVMAMLVLGGLVGGATGLVRGVGGDPRVHRHPGGPVGAARHRPPSDPGLLDPDQPGLLVRPARPRLVPGRSAAGSAGGGHGDRRLGGADARPHSAATSWRSAPMQRRRVGPASLSAGRRCWSMCSPVSPRRWRVSSSPPVSAQASSNAAVGFELEVIAAVVLGGTALIGRPRHHRRHGARRAHHRRHRQRPDPRAHLALLHPDRHRADHPGRDLAQHARLSRASVSGA